MTSPPRYLYDLDFLLVASLRYSLGVFRKQSGSIFLADNGNGTIRLRAAIDPQGNGHVGEVFRIGNGFSGRVASEKAPRLIPDMASLRTFRLRDHSRYNSSLISAPILTSNGVLGVININSRDDWAPFEPHDLDTLVDLSEMIGQTLKRVLYYQKIVAENRHLEAKLLDMRRKKEEMKSELLRQDRCLDALLKAIPCGIIIFRADLSICRRNRKAAEILGLEHETDRMLSLEDLPIEWKPGQLDLILRDVFVKKTSRAFSHGFPTANHEIRVLKLRFSPAISFPNGDPTAVLEIKDRSSKFRLEKGMRKSEKFTELNTIAAAIAHEINGPLDGIMRLTRMSLQSLDYDNPVRAVLVESLEKQDQIAAIGKSLLSFVRRYGQEADLLAARGQSPGKTVDGP